MRVRGGGSIWSLQRVAELPGQQERISGAMSTRHRRKQQGISTALTAVSQVFTWKKYSELGSHRHEGLSRSELSGKRGVFGKTFR